MTTATANLKAAKERAVSLTIEQHAAGEALRRAVQAARAEGMTLQAIGDVLGLTRQRVKQMLDAERKP